VPREASGAGENHGSGFLLGFTTKSGFSILGCGNDPEDLQLTVAGYEDLTVGDDWNQVRVAVSGFDHQELLHDAARY
jgi:hypothetical protein